MLFLEWSSTCVVHAPSPMARASPEAFFLMAQESHVRLSLIINKVAAGIPELISTESCSPLPSPSIPSLSILSSSPSEVRHCIENYDGDIGNADE